MARVSNLWKIVGDALMPVFTESSVQILISGIDKYINFNTQVGEAGYGIRDNSGTIEVKSFSGAWGAIGTSSDVPEFEKVNKNLSSYPSTLTYTSGNLTSIAYNTGGGTITKTLGYVSDVLTTITLSGSLPGGLTETIKTLSYTGDDLTGIIYS